jgi:hypothetical protein
MSKSFLVSNFECSYCDSAFLTHKECLNHEETCSAAIVVAINNTYVADANVSMIDSELETEEPKKVIVDDWDDLYEDVNYPDFQIT